MFLLFDIGGTNMRVAISIDGNTIAQSKIIPTPKDFDQGIQTLKQAASELSSGEKITGVAGGIAGPLDSEESMLVASPHISGWIQKPLKQELEKIFNCEVKLENDADLGGLGESTKGAGQNHEIVVYLTISTGVGGVRVVNGKIDENVLGFEPGHQIIVADGNPCNCGGQGHLEAYVGGYYLEKKYQQKPEDIKNPKIWDEVAKYLSIGLNNTIVHWSPDIVVLGGSVMKSLPLDMVTNHLKDALTIFPQSPQLILATLGHDAGLFGALHLLANN